MYGATLSEGEYEETFCGVLQTKRKSNQEAPSDRKDLSEENQQVPWNNDSIQNLGPASRVKKRILRTSTGLVKQRTLIQIL